MLKKSLWDTSDKGRRVHRLMLNESDEETKEIHDINDTNNSIINKKESPFIIVV